MKMLRYAFVWLVSLALVACGGGGGNAGGSLFGGGTGTGTGTGGSPAAGDSVNITVDVRNASGTSISKMGSAETVKVLAAVSTVSGSPVEGVVVAFAESGASLLKFAPSSKTALTNAQGLAEVEVSASDPTLTGATLITAKATGVTIVTPGQKAIEITAGGSSPVIPQPNAINFVQVVPASSSIVIKGAGGAGRSESATLTFKVVDGSNAPIKGALVNFSVNPANVVTLNIPSAESNSDGLASTTVSSGTSPTAVVVTATSAVNLQATTQSDTLVVSNGPVLPAGFELVAKKYNLDGMLTGDKTDITAFVRDEFGNPVPQGVAVSFVSDFGAVGTATSGGCSTNNAGQCTVPFTVQDPRGNGLATIRGTIKKGDGTEITRTILINMAGSTGGYAALLPDQGGQVLASITTSSADCKAAVNPVLSDSAGRAAAAGTVISVTTLAGLTASVSDGTPVLDQRNTSTFAPLPFTLEVSTVGLGCNPSAPNPTAAVSRLTLKYTTPGGTVMSQRVDINYSKP